MRRWRQSRREEVSEAQKCAYFVLTGRAVTRRGKYNVGRHRVGAGGVLDSPPLLLRLLVWAPAAAVFGLFFAVNVRSGIDYDAVPPFIEKPVTDFFLAATLGVILALQRPYTPGSLPKRPSPRQAWLISKVNPVAAACVLAALISVGQFALELAYLKSSAGSLNSFYNCARGTGLTVALFVTLLLTFKADRSWGRFWSYFAIGSSAALSIYTMLVCLNPHLLGNTRLSIGQADAYVHLLVGARSDVIDTP